MPEGVLRANMVVKGRQRDTAMFSILADEWPARRDAIAALYDERFCRMFEFYLVGCELAFRREDHMNWQMQLSPSRDGVPLTRDYMIEAERRPGAARAEAGAGAGAAALSP